MKKALIVSGGWEGHEPEKTTAIVAGGLRARGFSVDVSRSLASYLRAGRYDVLIQNWTMGEIGPKQLAALLAAVKSGAGFAGWHGGAGDSFRNATEYQFMVGGQFVSHPGGITDYKVRILKPRDPVVKGLKDFRVRSEQYYMHVDPSNQVLAETVFRGKTGMPAVWKRLYGRGRVFYSSIGHSAKDFEVPEVLEIILRGAAWAARR